MRWIDSIVNIFRKKEKPVPAEWHAPEGYCPNCWGRQSYGGQLYEAYKNKSPDVNSKDPDKGWILDYAEKYLQDIKLKSEDDAFVCTNCKLTYRELS